MERLSSPERFTVANDQLRTWLSESDTAVTIPAFGCVRVDNNEHASSRTHVQCMFVPMCIRCRPGAKSRTVVIIEQHFINT